MLEEEGVQLMLSSHVDIQHSNTDIKKKYQKGSRKCNARSKVKGTSNSTLNETELDISPE